MSPSPRIVRRRRTPARAVRRALPLACLAALASAACGPGQAAPPAAPPPASVSVAHPVVRRLTEWDQFTGRLEAVSSVEVRARVSGYLEAVHFTDGSIVREGDLLCSIDPRPFQAEVDRREAELKTAEARQVLAEQLEQRARRLLDRNATSVEDYDQRAGELAQAEAGVAAADAALTAAKLDLEFTRVTAPIAGRIGRHLVSPGNLIGGGSALATLLATINSLDPIHVYIDADEADYLRYVRLDRAGKRPSSRHVQHPVLMGLEDEEGHPHVGRIDFVDNRLDPDTGTMRGRAVFDNPDGVLTPGLFARVLLRGSLEYEALLVPDAALQTDQTTRFVWVVEQGTARRRTVLPGPMAYGLRIVREGLSADDVVIVGGLQRVRPGAPVAPETVEIPLDESDAPPDLPDAVAPPGAEPSPAPPDATPSGGTPSGGEPRRR